jgi:hypothetical protein
MSQSHVRELDFEDRFEQRNGVERMTDANIARFIDLLSVEDDSDSYATSPAYYAFTGRRGLWVYHYDKTYLPLCWHPNVDGQILVFPPRGEKNFAAIKSLMCQTIQPPEGFLLARFKPEDIIHLKTFDTFLQRVSFTPVTEEVLDWRYAARILSTESTTKMLGRDYWSVRKYVRKINKHQPDVRPILLKHIPEIEALISHWANQQSDNADQLTDLVAPYREILRLLKYKSLGLEGIVSLIDGRIQSTTVWDISNAKNCTANLYMNLCNMAHRGLSEFCIKATAEILFAQGIQYMNLGGSETSGLDHYKKKFIPAFSIDLCSLETAISDAAFATKTAVVSKKLKVA